MDAELARGRVVGHWAVVVSISRYRMALYHLRREAEACSQASNSTSNSEFVDERCQRLSSIRDAHRA